MNKTFKGIQFQYDIDKEVGVIKVVSPNIEGTTELDETNRYPGFSYRNYKHEELLPNEWIIYGEFINALILEHFWGVAE